MENENISFGKAFLNGLFFKNPLLTLYLGLTLAIIATTRVEIAFFVAVIALIDIFCTQLIVSLLRKQLTKISAFILAAIISAGIATIFTILIDNLLPGLVTPAEGYDQFAVVLYSVVPFVATTSLVLGKTEDTLSQKTSTTIADSLGSGLGFLLALVILAVIREILATGAISFVTNSGNVFGPVLFKKAPAALFAKPFGGFLLAGLFCGLHGTILACINKKQEKKEEVK
jgi:electron transport complex protein RnfE